MITRSITDISLRALASMCTVAYTYRYSPEIKENYLMSHNRIHMLYTRAAKLPAAAD